MKKVYLVHSASQRKGVCKRFSFSVTAVGYENYWKICKVNNERPRTLEELKTLKRQ
jgi:hypothetical protein